MDAKVVHLQLFIAFALHLLCTLYLQTSQLKPWEVTPETILYCNCHILNNFTKILIMIILLQ